MSRILVNLAITILVAFGFIASNKAQACEASLDWLSPKIGQQYVYKTQYDFFIIEEIMDIKPHPAGKVITRLRKIAQGDSQKDIKAAIPAGTTEKLNGLIALQSKDLYGNPSRTFSYKTDDLVKLFKAEKDKPVLIEGTDQYKQGKKYNTTLELTFLGCKNDQQIFRIKAPNNNPDLSKKTKKKPAPTKTKIAFSKQHNWWFLEFPRGADIDDDPTKNPETIMLVKTIQPDDEY